MPWAGEHFSRQQAGCSPREAEKPPPKSSISCSVFCFVSALSYFAVPPWPGAPRRESTYFFHTLCTVCPLCAFDVAVQFSREGTSVSPTYRLTPAVTQRK